MRAPRCRHSLRLVFSRCSDLNIVVVVAVVVVVVVVVPGACCCYRYTLQQLASRACKCPGSRRRVVATTANPSPQDVACPAEKSTRSRPADIKETFYERELRNDVYTRRLSDFYERKSDIASVISTRYITAH